MSKTTAQVPSRPAAWPKPVRRAFESILVVFANAYLAARSRAMGSPSKTVRLLAEIDDLRLHNALLERELAVQRRRINSMPPAKRPHFLPDDRGELLAIIRYQGWNARQTARRLVIHRNTLRNWRKRFLRGESDGFFGSAPFNKLDDSVRWLVHEMHSLGARFGKGTRTIAAEICKAGIKLSRSSVQRILREPKPRRPRPGMVPALGEKTRHILRPEKINRTWHLDLAVVTRLGQRLHVAALLDGYSRKLLVLKSYARTPTSIMMLALVRRAIEAYGKPRFLVCDHGCQFRTWFRERLESKFGVTPVSGKVRSPTFNGKVERFFRTFRDWSSELLVAFFADKVRTCRWFQRRLDIFREWYNEIRLHQALGGRTPEDVWASRLHTEPQIVRASDAQPEVSVKRKWFRGDHHLPVLDITVRLSA
jgi:transposase InsO family protein/transposase-like protein